MSAASCRPTINNEENKITEDIYSKKNMPCSITICTMDKMKIFKNKQFAITCIDLLNKLAEKEGIKLYAYCFMPDHIHLISVFREL